MILYMIIHNSIELYCVYVCSASVVSAGGMGVSSHTPWPLRNSKVFHTLNAMMERCNDLTELVNTIHDFRWAHISLMHTEFYFGM